ncbi:MAG: hypothetical protein QXX46_04845 [Candidatus Anstonellales archaeon]
MPATEIERSLYAAYLTKWKGKLPNEKQFEEWKREQISLYERAATVSEQIAAILENKELSEEDKRTQIEEILRKDPEAGEKLTKKIKQETPGFSEVYYIGVGLRTSIADDFISKGESTELALQKADDLIQQYSTDPQVKQQLDEKYGIRAWSVMLSSMESGQLSEYGKTFSQSSNKLNLFKYDKSAIKMNILIGYAGGVVAVPELKKQAGEELNALKEQFKEGK